MVQESPIHGQGVFAAKVIPCGTVLGSYPGRVRPGEEMVLKVEKSPMAKVGGVKVMRVVGVRVVRAVVL